MSRWPIRVRLTAAFMAAMLVVLAGAGAFVYVRVRSDLGDALTASLHARADDVAALAARPGEGLRSGAGLLDAEEGFAQVVSRSGRLLSGAGGASRPALDRRALARAAGATIVLETTVPGIEARARVLARAASADPGAPIVVVGRSLDDRDETLSGLLGAFLVGGPIAVAVTGLIGYLIASAGLAPVEAMRRRAAEVSLEREQSLPLPAADDELRRLGQTLNEMLARLRGSFERERRFVADASHELRTPVAVLRAEIEAALADGSFGPAVGESLGAALAECDHLAQLAEDLLLVARDGDQGLPVRPELVQALPLLEAVRQRFAERARLQGRRIEVEADGDPQLCVDPLRMRQALGNLVDNALRHGAGQITLGGRRDGDTIELSVADEGPGFGADLGERAFDRFARGDGARTSGGAGLGLAIVRTIADAHAGEAEIVPGEPTVVRLRLPAG